MDLNDPSLQADGPCTVRLHVGGLGPSVISSDLVQVFSSLAKVSCVDLVHTKGRNFAYVTIQAASRDIKRLFSLYNGCMWKGGRLKLEKAREFYLDKLHREWADRDFLQAIQPPKLDCSSAGRSVLKSKDSSGFKIYIPKLRKVKTIPDKGLGKHKRSFERMDPLPYSLLQVCNCDQNCTTTSHYQSRTRKGSSRMAEDKGLQDAKLTIIKTSRNDTSTGLEQIYKAPGYSDRNGFGKRPGIHWKNGDEQGRNGAPTLDEPILNVNGGASHSDKGDITEYTMDIDEPVLNVTGFNDFCFGKTKDSMEAEVHAVTKEQAQACREEVQLMGGVGFVQKKRLKSDPDTRANNENKQLGEMKKFTDLVLQRGETNGSTGRSWVQKASWKSLVGETGRMSFNLGSMLDQSLNSNPESTSKELVQSATCKDLSSSKLIDRPSILTRSNVDHHASSLVQDGGEGILQTSECSRPCSTIGNKSKQTVKEENLALSKLRNGDDQGFAFVKSSTSEQDWLESKQAVKRIVKWSHKDAVKTLKGLHTWQKH